MRSGFVSSESHIGYSILCKWQRDLLRNVVIIFWYNIARLIHILDKAELPRIFPTCNILPLQETSRTQRLLGSVKSFRGTWIFRSITILKNRASFWNRVYVSKSLIFSRFQFFLQCHSNQLLSSRKTNKEVKTKCIRTIINTTLCLIPVQQLSFPKRDQFTVKH